MRRLTQIVSCVLLLASLWGCGTKKSVAETPETDKPDFDSWLETQPDTQPETTTPAPETTPVQTTLPETEPTEAPFTWLEVTEDELNIRTGPGVGYEAQWQVHTGDLVKIYEEDQGWGLTDWGWISLDYTKPCANPQNAELCVPTKPVPKDPYGSIIEALLTDPSNPGFDMSYLYAYCSDVSKILYAMVDLDGNGQQELLLIGEGSDYPFDCFTVRNDKAVSVFSSGERYPYYVYQDGYVMNHWSGGAAISGTDYLRYQNGKLVLVERLTFDAQYAEESGIFSDMTEATGDNCWFTSNTTDTSGYQHIPYEEVDRRMREYAGKLQTLYPNYEPITAYFD